MFLQAMAAVLSMNTAIQRLNLEFCKIGDAGVEAWWPGGCFAGVGPVCCLVLWGRNAVAGECGYVAQEVLYQSVRQVSSFVDCKFMFLCTFVLRCKRTTV